MKTNLIFSGELLKKRVQLGFTQSDMAEVLDISLRWYSEIESGRKMPRSELIFEICRLLDIDMNKIRDAVPLNKDAIEQVKNRKRNKAG